MIIELNLGRQRLWGGLLGRRNPEQRHWAKICGWLVQFPKGKTIVQCPRPETQETGGAGAIPALGRSPGEGNGNQL